MFPPMEGFGPITFRGRATAPTDLPQGVYPSYSPSICRMQRVGLTSQIARMSRLQSPNPVYSHTCTPRPIKCLQSSPVTSNQYPMVHICLVVQWKSTRTTLEAAPTARRSSDYLDLVPLGSRYGSSDGSGSIRVGWKRAGLFWLCLRLSTVLGAGHSSIR